MKKLVALSVCLSASTILLAASPSFSQTVTVPITGTNIGLNITPTSANSAIPRSFIVNATLLTPLGAVSISAFNGSISANTPSIGAGLFNVTASTITNTGGNPNFYNDTNGSVLTTFVFTGTTNGTAPFVPNNAFTNAPTTINATFSTAQFVNPTPIQVNVPSTGGSITLPAPPPVVVVPPPVVVVLPPVVVVPPPVVVVPPPVVVVPPPVVVVPPPVVVVPPPVTCTDCLIVRPDLLIANSTFLSPDSQEPEYRQEYKNDFSASSFRGGRILGLEDK